MHAGDLTKIEWANRVWHVVAPIAAEGGTITYGDLAKTVNYESAVYHGHFADVLAIVALESPEVAGAVVRKDTGLPGKGHDRFVAVMRGWNRSA